MDGASLYKLGWTSSFILMSILGNIKEAVKKDIKKKSFETPTEKRSRKAKKALQQHMQIVASLENTK